MLPIIYRFHDISEHPHKLSNHIVKELRHFSATEKRNSITSSLPQATTASAAVVWEARILMIESTVSTHLFNLFQQLIIRAKSSPKSSM